ncbi:hypothetical protein [Microbacterium oleivorans]|uniref:hypothetical protein n=1 Tax=Microbacterium oleivorans TaxID=273677 RepID=UPI0016705CAA|nr:hypothetical protein [Microbacterium oleivorans]
MVDVEEEQQELTSALIQEFDAAMLAEVDFVNYETNGTNRLFVREVLGDYGMGTSKDG